MRRARSESDGIPELIAQIRRYLFAHPSAADNLNGIRSSWLNGSTVPIATVQAAVDQLIVEGYLNRHKLADGSTLYRRAA
jgi:hypothetical protein